IRGVLHGHSFRRHVAIEAKRDVHKYLAHDFPLVCLDAMQARDYGKEKLVELMIRVQKKVHANQGRELESEVEIWRA
ncbi:MAG TPA: hypothetical protein VJ528_00410, partial [Geothrix sp.]|nr:hypothetical protein [Geothrix sp.]